MIIKSKSKTTKRSLSQNHRQPQRQINEFAFSDDSKEPESVSSSSSSEQDHANQLLNDVSQSLDFATLKFAPSGLAEMKAPTPVRAEKGETGPAKAVNFASPEKS